MYDSLMYVKKLEAVGIPRNQAEAQVEIMSQIIDSNFATKQEVRGLSLAMSSDMSALKTELRNDMSSLRSELSSEMSALKAELKHDIAASSAQLRLEIKEATLLYGKMLAATSGIIIAAMALLIKL